MKDEVGRMMGDGQGDRETRRKRMKDEAEDRVVVKGEKPCS
jgi:hypothetical protein